MVSSRLLRTRLLGRDVAVAYAVVVALYLLRLVRFQPLQIPAYLLVVTYDAVEVALPALAPHHPVAFPLFLYVVAVVAAAATRWLAGDTRDERGDESGRERTGRSAWLRPLGGVCLVVGTLSFAFAAFVGGPAVAATDNPTPLAITGATGAVCVAVGWWLLGRPRIRRPRAVTRQ